MTKKCLGVLAVMLSCCCSYVAAEVFVDDFKSYRNYDPGIHNWNFRGIGGEVIDGKYMFTGLTQKQSEYWDVHPDYTMGLVRGWNAGPALMIEATMKSSPHKYRVFAPGKNENRKMGIVILDREFVRGKRTPMNAPFLELTLNQSAAGKRSVSFRYCGEPKIRITERGTGNTPEWKDGVTYEFELTLRGNRASGKISSEGKVLYHQTLESSDFSRIFPRAYPGFCNRKMTGELHHFKADDLNSATGTAVVRPLPFPRRWQSSLGQGTVTFSSGKTVDFGALFGGHSKGKTIVLRSEIEVPERGLYAVKCRADWFWKIAANGKLVTPVAFFGKGSGGKDKCIFLPLERGLNKLELSVRSGAAGWSFRFTAADRIDINNELMKGNVYGSGKVAWTFDRLLDDLNNLKRHGIILAATEAKVIAARKGLTPDLDARRILSFDPLLDQAFSAIYDGYRCIELENTIAELNALKAAGDKVATLSQMLSEMKKRVGAGAHIEGEASKAQRIISECRERLNGFAEGVTRGGNFGRFGWITSDKLGSYSSGDGLLANQILSSGAIVRQYVTSADNEKTNYLVRFRFGGETDATQKQTLSALPTIGHNVEIEFGYAPTLFYSGTTPEQVKIKDINWIHKKYSFADAFVMDAALVSPSLLLESAYQDFVLSDSPSGAFEFIGYKKSDGKVYSGDAAGDGVIYELKKDGPFGSNWVVLWNGGNTERDLAGHRGNVPLQVIFQHQPQRIVRKGREIIISFQQGGALWLNTLYGVRIQPTGNWRGQLPPMAVGKADFFGRSALAYPEQVREFFRYDKTRGLVEILNRYTFRTFESNDWNIKPLKIAVLPPVLSLMTDQGFDAVLPEHVKDLDYPTLYGPLRGIEGSEITYSLPVPEVPDLALPANNAADAKEVARLKERSLSGIEGQRFRFYDEAMSRSWHSLNMPGSGVFKQWQYLDPEFKAYLKGLFAYNLIEANGYRSNRLWRSLIEPYSGRKYFYSFSISVRNPGEVGVFGDRGYGVGLHFNQLDKWSSYSGRYDLLKQIWRDEAPLAPPEASRDGKYLTVDKMFGYVKNVHDWAWMEDGSNDNGDNGPVVDCSQAPFAGNCAYFRMAKEVGNEREIARGAYHLAKGQLSLIGRLPFTGYGRANGLLGADRINVGFRECITPECFANSSMLSRLKRGEYDGSYVSTLSYATSDDGFDIYFPYTRYIWNTMRDYEKLYQQYFPNCDTDSESHGQLFSRMMFLLLSGQPIDKVKAIYDHQMDKLIFYLRDANERTNLPLLISGGCPLVLSGWAPLEVPRVVFSPTEKNVRIRFDRVPADYVLRGLSSQKPASIQCGGTAVTWNYDLESYRLTVSVPPGDDVVLTVQYDSYDPDHFMPLPVPPGEKSVAPFTIAPGPEAFRRASPVKAPQATKTVASTSLLYRADFSGEQGKNLDSAGKYYFHDWGKSGAKASGGLTGSYPSGGAPAHCLEVEACRDNFSGRVSPKIILPAKSGGLRLCGQVVRSKDYAGNDPMIFLWIVGPDGKGKPMFFNLTKHPNGEWQEFSFSVKAADLPSPGELLLNLTSRKAKNATGVSGSLFYREVKVSVE